MNIADFACGLLAGWAQVLVGQPLDYIKVKIQTAQLSISATQVVKDIYQDYGLKGFYRGSSSLFLGFSCTIGVQFFIYESAKKYFYRRREQNKKAYDPAKLHLWEVGVAGAYAGWFVTFVYCPIEYAKIQRQVSSAIHESSVGWLLRQLYTKGIRTIYRGFWVTALREVFGSFFYYFTYESIVRLCTGKDRSKADSAVFLGAGATAGVYYHLLTYPIDTIKSNIQAGNNWKQAVANSLMLSKMAGFKIALMWAVLVNACGFWVYEHAQRRFNNFNTSGSLYPLD